MALYSVDDELYATRFGFTKNEVNKMMNYFGLDNFCDDAKIWYNGYNFWGQEIYNPFSVTNFVGKRILDFYWILNS